MSTPTLRRVLRVPPGLARRLARSLTLATGFVLVLGACNLTAVSPTPTPPGISPPPVSTLPTGSAVPTPAPAYTLETAPGSSASPLVVMAAGDIACDPADPNFKLGVGTSTNCRQGDTAKLLAGADLILTLGDNQYECGGLAAYQASFDRSWGAFKALIRPTLGNHEYEPPKRPNALPTNCDPNESATGYFAYFGAAAPAAHYSFDAGGWHFATVDSSCGQAGVDCATEATWLSQDLAAHPAVCSIVFYHQTRWTSGDEGPSPPTDPFWRATVAAGVELVLNGHDHDYERFAPMDGNGAASETGMREFVVGTGGYNTTRMPNLALNSEVRNDTTFGVLALSLHAGSYDWRFLPIAGQTFTDSGSGTCH